MSDLTPKMRAMLIESEPDLPDIGRHPEDYWPLDCLRPGVRPKPDPFGRPVPDLSDCVAERLPGRPWLLQLWEPLHTKAPSPSRCQPWRCYVSTVIFYHRPYISAGKGRGFAEYDQVKERLRWDNIILFDGDEWEVDRGFVRWHRKRWWMRRTARRVKKPELRAV